MGFLDKITGSKKEVIKRCSFRKKEITISKEIFSDRYGAKYNCFFCRDSTSFYIEHPCEEEQCVYHMYNSMFAETAMDRKLGNNPNLTNRDIRRKVEKLSLNEYSDLMLTYRDNLLQHCD
jgi:hypothetical protein